MPKTKKTRRKRLQKVSIRAERHSEPDWDKYAWALLQHVRLLNKQANKVDSKEPRGNGSV